MSNVPAEVARVLTALSIDWRHDENYKDTPDRFAAYLGDHFPGEDVIAAELEDCRKAVFPSNYEGMVAVGPTIVWGLCPHHLLPVRLTIWTAYLAHHKAIGISKLARVPMILGKLAALQEDTTRRVAEELLIMLDTDHVAVWIEGQHFCMVIRGAEQSDATTTTSEMRGLFRDDAGVKCEFLLKVERSR